MKIKNENKTFIILQMVKYFLNGHEPDFLHQNNGMKGTEELQDLMNGGVPALGDLDNWVTEVRALIHGISLVWGFLIKYFIPVFSSFILLATFAEDGKHPYEGYKDGNLWRGFFYFEAMVIIVQVVTMFPQILKQASGDTGESNW